MTAFDTAWALLKNEPFFHCPNCNLKDEYHNSRDGSIFCRGCGRYFVADLEGNWQEYERGSNLGDLFKAFQYPEFWHGTSVANAKKILEEGFNPYSFGSPHDEDAISYAYNNPPDMGDESGPALLGFDTTEDTIVLDPLDEGYDFGTEEYGHIMMQNRLDPKNIRLFAAGHPNMTEREWWDFVLQLQQLDMLDRTGYPDMAEAYANRWRRLFE